MTHRLDWEKLNRYINGEADSTEMEHVRGWMGESADRAEFIASLQAGPAGAHNSLKAEYTSSMWKRHLARRTVSAGVGIPPGMSAPYAEKGVRLPQRRALLPNWLNVSAFLVVLAVAGIYGSSVIRSDVRQSDMVREISTEPGQRSTIELSDGTQLILAPETRVTVAAGYGTTTRQISIDGEVFVKVAQKSNVPFIVVSDDIETRVLGTSFSVRKYREDQQVRVAVIDGRVEVGGSIVDAGSVAFVSEDKKNTKVSRMSDPDSYIGWTRGKLSYRDVDLETVLRELSRSYGITINVEGSGLYQHKITADFINQNVDEMLSDLATVVGASVIRNDGRATLVQKTL